MPDWQEVFHMPEFGPEMFFRKCRMMEKLRRRHKKTARRRLFLQCKVAKRTGLEPATSSVTGWRSNRTELPLHDLGLSRLAAGTWRLIQALPGECKTRNHFFLHAGCAGWEKWKKCLHGFKIRKCSGMRQITIKILIVAVFEG
jgi:hypothetical protein